MSQTEYPTRPPIAIVGAAALFPGSVDAGGFWKDILEGVDRITDVPPSHWLIEDYYDPDPSAPDKTYARRGAFLEAVDFDPMEWGIPPSILEGTDTCQLLALVVAKQVLEDAANGQFATMDRSRISCILGVTSAQELLGTLVSRLQRPVWTKALREIGLPETKVQAACDKIAAQYVPWQESSFPGVLGNVVAGRIANRLDLGGTNCVSDAACASALSALSMACQELWLGSSDLVITGGVDTMNDIFMFMCFSKTPALSPSGDCAPFSDTADGTMLGEGLGMVALKRLEEAEAQGDHIYAVIQGVGSSSDGRAKSVYAPVPQGQAQAVRRAYERAGYAADTVELIEAHGTGTKAGDAAEFSGLCLSFGDTGREDRQWCALGSVKSQVGHTKAAAGAAGLFKGVMALHHKVLPPTIKVRRPNPNMDLANSPFYLSLKSRPWIRSSRHPRRAGVSSFGFGGSNFHIALEEHTGPRSVGRLRTAPSELVLISAEGPESLVARCRELAEAEAGRGWLAWAARTSQLAWDASKPARAAVVATDQEAARALLRQIAEHASREPDARLASPGGAFYARGSELGKIAFLFPGQGSQYLEMGADLAMAHDAARAVWDREADAPVAEEALHQVVYPVPAFGEEAQAAQATRLTATEWAQPAIGATSAAMLALLRDLGLEPDCVGGHSFGEITALHAAGVLDERDFLRVARRRGELMRDAAAIPGAMTAVSVDISKLRPLLDEWSLDVVIANHNGPRQVVLSGSIEAMVQAEAKLSAARITFKRLPVATAFHSKLVSPSSEPFLTFLRDVELRPASVDVFSNAAAAVYPAAADDKRARLAEQIASPVRFVEQIEAMYERGVRCFVEVGPGSVLTDLVGRILARRPHLAVSLDRKGRHGLTSLQHALGRLAVAGAPLAFESLWAEYREVADPRSLRKPGLTVRISGANHNKPYPPPGGAAFLPAPNPESEEEVCAVKSAMSHETKSASAPPRGSGEPLVTPPREPAPAVPVPEAKPRVEAPGPTTPVAAPAAGWLHAFEEAQRFTAEAHAQYQRSMAESHKAFLQAVETSFVGLNSMLHGQPMPQPALSPESQALAAPVVLTPAPAVIGAEPAALAPPPVATPAPVPQPPAAVPAPLPQPPAQVREEPVAPRDLSSLLLEVVAEKTGYPAEMLKPGMNLESDLGIDSIKRVEILSTLRERAPELPELDPGDLATLQTLGQIVEHMGTHGGDAGGAGDVPPPPGEAPAGAGGLEALLLEVVAEKTGYPAEMLKPGMNLESDLGIDSIKRVEILSTLRERAPELPELDPGDLATLQTLGQIVEHMGSNPGSASASGGSGKAPVQAAELGRYVLREVEAPAAGLSLPGLATAERVVITSDDRGVAAAVVDQLARRGVSARVCDEVAADADAVVFLGGITDADPRLVHRSAFAAARAVAARFAERGGLLVTVQDTGGDFGLSGAQDRAWYGGLPGLVKTAAREWPTAHCKAIDLERGDRGPERLAEAIVTELLAGGHELEVGLHADGRRTTLESQTSKCVPGTPVLEPGDVVVASGGARGVTAACLVALAATCRLRLVLLGRTPLRDEPEATHAARTDAELKTALMLAEQAAGRQPSPADIGRRVRGILAGREIRQTLAAIRRSGAEARYESVDVGDPAALGAALDRVRGEWGPVRGLVHGAGVLADRLIADKTPEQFDAVFDTKVGGLRALLEATRDDPLKALVMFSSVAGRCGNAGQVDYAMANEVLNKVASAEAARRGIVVRSLGWGPWEGGMVTPALKAKFESLGVPLIPLQAGARVLVDELSDGQAEQVELVIGGSPDTLLPGGPAPAVRLAVRVHADTHVALRDHSVKGVPVLPVAYALEWFARALRALRPDLRIGALRDVKVLRGVRLEGFDGRGDWLEVSARQLTNGDGATVALELDGPDGARHYAATAELVERPVAPGRTESVAVEPWATEIYDGHVLFHGPAWRVIRSLDGASEQGISGEMRGVAASSSEPWQIDVPLVDGALQMALLWTKFLHGGASLPTALEAVTIHELGPVEGDVRCVLVGRRASGEKTVSDIALVRGDGTLVAELRGVETCLLPGEKRRDLTAARPVA